MKKNSQCYRILKIIYENKWKEWWSAKDFQAFGKWFIGYEATARISDLIREYPELFETKKDGRFRLIKLIENQDKKILELLGE